MARARSIKPGFFKNEDLAECSPWARLCFAGLWTLADRDGRLEDRPKRIKGELFAFDAIEVEPLLQELASRGGFIRRYRAGDLALIQILNFGKHQNPHHREAPSLLSAPEGWVQQVAEPEASGSSHDGKARGQPEASPGLLPHEMTLQGVKAVLTPDSLFSDPLTPDSGLLTVDRQRNKRRTQLPAEFRPNEAGMQAMEGTGLELEKELSKFRDHHLAKGSLMADWQAAWRTWIGNAVEFAASRSRTTGQQRPSAMRDFSKVNYAEGADLAT